jgi:tetratricopeptide (TPR) repeat protein
VGERPGIANRPGVGQPGTGDRPGVGNRPVDPGYGVRPPANNAWRGAYWGYHKGWANGYWHGYHANNNWGWGWFAAGAATGVTAWALGSSFYNWGYAPYANPYYYAEPVAQPIVFEQSISGSDPQTVSVPMATYDYSQPLDTESTPPEAKEANPALAKFDQARSAFGMGDYASALQLTDEALKTLPNDATLHEFRALVLFAVGKYDLAAGPLYAVLSVGPGWDWTTLAGLYPNIDTYTAQLRKLEAYVKANPQSPAGHFVLAYHYITQNHVDAAVAQLKKVTELTPQDALSNQLLAQFAPTKESAATPSSEPPPTTAPVKPGSLAGKWTARPTPDTTITLTIDDKGQFTWVVDAKGKPQRLEGNWSLAGDTLTLDQSGQGGPLVGTVAWQEDRWNFRVLGATPSDPGLTFTH